MTSSDVAFEKFASWKKLNILLKAICLPKDKNSSFETHLTVSVFSVIPEEFMVGLIAETRPHNSFPLDLRAAKFSLSEDGKSLEVFLADGERWSFTEKLPS
jgi:hypothetical protein